MTGMMFPKGKYRKKRKRHKASILQEKDGTCYLCRKLDHNNRRHPVIHEHHVYGGQNRAVSEAEGFKVYPNFANPNAAPSPETFPYTGSETFSNFTLSPFFKSLNVSNAIINPPDSFSLPVP